MNTRFLIIIAILIIFILPVYAFNSSDHNDDTCRVIFGYDGWNDFESETDPDSGLRYAFYIVTDALFFAVDYNGNNYQLLDGIFDVINCPKKYTELIRNINSLNRTITFPEMNNNNFPKLGGGKHRQYCHQGFYYSYPVGKSENSRRWILGRDKILVPACCVAFGLNPKEENDCKIGEIIAVISYYSHMIGDLREGKISSVEDMVFNGVGRDSMGGNGGCVSFRDLLKQLSSDLQTAFEKAGISNNNSLDDFLEKVTSIIQKCETNLQEDEKDRDADYLLVRDFLVNYCGPIVWELVSDKITVLNNQITTVRIYPRYFQQVA